MLSYLQNFHPFRHMETFLHLFPFFKNFNYLTLLVAIILCGIYLAYKRRGPVYLLDFVCYKPHDSLRVPMSMYLENNIISKEFTPEGIQFQIKILEKSSFSQETCIPPSLSQIPKRRTLSFAREEAETVIFSIVRQLFEKNDINPKTIDILVLNCSLFCPTPSLTSMIINKFGLRSNVMSYNLSGMGCSAGILSVSLARDLLSVHRNALALVVSAEMLTLNWYTGENRSMLLTNCLFRMGGAAVLMSSRKWGNKTARYMLQHMVRTNKACDDQSYTCVFQDTDDEDKVGVSLSKDILYVAGDALKANISSFGPLVLPLSEKIKYGFSLIHQKILISAIKKPNIYVPNFKKALDHFCIHAGGRAVIQAIEEKLGLNKEDVEASKMTLYRFGNTSSSSIWYELCYIEAKGRVHRGDRVWQIAFGSGFKCNSAVWKCISDSKVASKIENAWSDMIHLYPADIPESIKID